MLIRYDPKRNERFPSLFAAGRSGRPRKKKGAGPDEASPKGESPPPVL